MAYSKEWANQIDKMENRLGRLGATREVLELGRGESASQSFARTL